MRTLLLAALAGVLLLTACRGPRPLPTHATEPAPDAGATPEKWANTLGPGDLVEVRVFQEPDLSGPYRVAPDGSLDFPLCGRVAVRGMTSSDVSDALTHCLANGYLKRPQVTVLVREYNSKKIFVFGEVQKPGTFPYEGDMSIIQAITLAGGFTKLAARNNTQVTRIAQGQEQRTRVPVEDIGVGREKNFLLQ